MQGRKIIAHVWFLEGGLHVLLGTLAWRKFAEKDKDLQNEHICYHESIPIVMSHFNLYLWLKQLKVRGHICKPPMPQIMVIRHRPYEHKENELRFTKCQFHHCGYCDTPWCVFRFSTCLVRVQHQTLARWCCCSQCKWSSVSHSSTMAMRLSPD